MRTLPLAVLMLGAAGALSAQQAPAAAAAPGIVVSDLKGNWKCAVDVQGQSWPVSLQIVVTDDAKPIALIENLSPGDRPLTAAVTLKSGKLHLEVQGLDAGFDGKVNATHDDIPGSWAFGGMDLACDLRLQKTP